MIDAGQGYRSRNIVPRLALSFGFLCAQTVERVELTDAAEIRELRPLFRANGVRQLHYNGFQLGCIVLRGSVALR